MANLPMPAERLGAFRMKQVYIGKEFRNLKDSLFHARYVPPPVEHVPPLMDNLSEVMIAQPPCDALIDCAIFHYQFEAIHPFEDGNGRMGRLLIPLYLMSKGVIDSPYLYLSSYFEPRKDEYVDLMKAVSTHGEWNEWVLFFLEAVRVVADESKERAQTELGLHKKYREKIKAETSTQTPLAAIDLIMSKVIVTVRDLAEHNSCSPNTAKSALKVLNGLGIVKEVKKRYPQTWIAEELIDKVYNTGPDDTVGTVF